MRMKKSVRNRNTVANNKKISHKLEKKKKMENKVRVHNLIILDESGSMMSIYKPALDGVNETLQTIRQTQSEKKDQKHFVTLVTFDSTHYNQIYAYTPADEARDITKEQYRPCGGTPLYDAMGRAINTLAKQVEKDDVVLVTIITDGYENSSREYSGQAIKNLVEAKKADDWVFTYIGANQNVEAVAASMAIDNHLEFSADDEGTCAMFEKERNCRRSFFNKLAPGMSRMFMSKDYFKDEEDKD